MKKRIILLLVVMGLIFASCGGTDGQEQGFGFGGGSAKNTGSGESGIEFSFSDLSFVPQKGNDFSLYLIIKNHQRHEISDLTIKPVGFDWGYVQGGLQETYSVQMGSATESGPSQYSQVFDGIRLGDFVGDYDWNPVFKYCYTAKSQFREQVNIPNALGQIETSGGGQKFTNGPLTVTISEVFPKGESEIGVEFDVKNSLNGVVVNECYQDENQNQYGNKFDLNNVKLGSTTGTCVPISAQEYMINDNSAKFSCTFQRSGSDPYSSQISLELDYKYQQEIKKDITIKDLETR